MPNAVYITEFVLSDSTEKFVFSTFNMCHLFHIMVAHLCSETMLRRSSFLKPITVTLGSQSVAVGQ